MSEFNPEEDFDFSKTLEDAEEFLRKFKELFSLESPKEHDEFYDKLIEEDSRIVSCAELPSYVKKIKSEPVPPINMNAMFM